MSAHPNDQLPAPQDTSDTSLALNREAIADLGAARADADVRGGFIMQDTKIVPTGGRRGISIGCDTTSF